ncbi:MAG: efflux RND transporter permease subunit [Cyanobacteria bacterium P01_H01_bin.15]
MIFSISDLFIKRPVFTTVCSLIIVLVGAVCIPRLPISQLPQIAPTQVEISANYIGADAQTVEETVTTIIEREVNGVEEMRYISSNSNNSGSSNITVAFPAAVDRNVAQVNVQNRVAFAEPELPSSVQQTGVTVRKSSPDLLLGIAFFTEETQPNGEPLYDDLFLSNYLDRYVVDLVQRIEGVGSVVIFGERKYAMRLWVDPNALAARGLTAQDVVEALEEQNIQVGAGAIGQQPAPADQRYEITLRASSRFRSEEEFNDLVLQVGEDGTLIKVKDIGRVELGAESYNSQARFRGKPAIGLGIFQLPGSNALDVAQAVKEKIAELSSEFPTGMEYEVALDATSFVEVSLKEVIRTLLTAITLVVLIVFIFLQNWRAMLIPALVIPVSLIGTFIFLTLFQFEINTLTLFALVLATGLVVDDAIVIVEAITAKVQQGMPARAAAVEAMDELSGAVIATSLVLMAVFLPVAFYPGTTGIIYRQFALTIAFAIAISTFNALSFSPTIGAMILNNTEGEGTGPLGRFFRIFNRFFQWLTERYWHILKALTGRFMRLLVLAGFTAALGFTFFLFRIVPTGFIPEEDQGYFFTIVQAPDGVSLNYTNEVMDKVGEQIAQFDDVVTGYFTLSGFSFDGNASNRGFVFSKLKPWEERKGPDKSVYALLNKVNGAFFQNITNARAFAVNAPPVRGLSSFGGFEMEVQDRRGMPISSLVENTFALIGAANERPEIAQAFTQFAANTPQIEVEVNRDRAKALDVNIDDIFGTLQTYLGSTYVNDFILDRRQYRVYVQADQNFRSGPSDINKLYVRSQNDGLIPLGNLVTLKEFTGPPLIAHYNLFRSIKIQGAPAPGYSTGQAIAAMEEVAAQVLAPGFGYEWTGTALEETETGGEAIYVFALGLIMVFLVLAAQYESYIDPIIILLSVPLAIMGALSAIWFRGNILQVGSVWPIINNDVYCQVGLVMLIGLASKNAILIVEFANQLREQGYTIAKAAIKAGQERFRPILMTAISSLVGFYPLLTATGAGASSRWSLGTAIFGGMTVATVLSLFIVPVFYILIKSWSDRYLGPHQEIPDDVDSSALPGAPQSAEPKETVISK